MVKWIRPIVSLIAVIGITAGFFMRMVSTDAYIGLMAVAVTYWYKSRDEEKAKKDGSL